MIMKNLKVLQPIKRILLYAGLCVITCICGLLLAFFGLHAIETEDIFLLVYLIPHFIFGLIFLKTKWIFKLVVPLLTSIVSFGCFRLINLDNMTDFEAFAYLVFPSIVFVWESAYQILKIKNTEETNK